MTLQRYELYTFHDAAGGCWIESRPNPESNWVQYSDAEAALATKDKEIERLRKALKDIADKYYCQCEPADTFDGEGPYLCNKCIARHALEARDE